MEELMRHLSLKNMKTKMFYLFFTSTFLFFMQASIATNYLENQVWFHPHDPSLKHISQILSQAKSSIDIAMYNMDTSTQSPIIEKLLEEKMQKRISSSDLQVRLIFQGYGDKKKRNAKLKKLESLGIDVRYFAKAKKLHHKFAVIDGQTVSAKLITGSANWSLSSYRNYNDNIIYFANSPLLSASYQIEFNFLWEKSTPFGKEKHYSPSNLLQDTNDLEAGVKAYFNSENLKKPSKNKKKITVSDYILTHPLVEKINQAQYTIDIATTRIKLFPVYKALLKAAKRGVKINIVVTMAQYSSWYKRKSLSEKNCEDGYQAHCSIGIKYSNLLEKASLKESNIKIKAKYFDLRPLKSIQKQMHHKYMIIDNQYLVTGSFNWSFSAEFKHIENLLILQKTHYPHVVEKFQFDFKKLWKVNKKGFDSLYFKIKENFKYKKKFSCSFTPLILEFSQIDKIRKLVSNYKRANKTREINLCF